MSQMGPLPVNCAIEATDLEEAIQKFPEAIAQAIERMVEEAKELQRQEASPNHRSGRSASGRQDQAFLRPPSFLRRFSRELPNRSRRREGIVLSEPFRALPSRLLLLADTSLKAERMTARRSLMIRCAYQPTAGVRAIGQRAEWSTEHDGLSPSPPRAERIAIDSLTAAYVGFALWMVD